MSGHRRASALRPAQQEAWIIPSAGSAGRAAFAIIAIVVLLVGAAMFFFPYSLATLPTPAAAGRPWPWLIGPLAVRFVGSALIAIALSAGLITLRPDRPSILAYAILMSIAAYRSYIFCVPMLYCASSSTSFYR